ncbi:MAG: helix-turn-helix transcriptional regulator [Desulfomonilaceae bacterium]
MRGTQMARQWKIIGLMETHRSGVSGNDLASKLDVPARTVYRDLDALQTAGFPLYTEKEGKNSVWKLLDTFRKDFPLPLTATELMALHMSRDLLSIFDGTVFRDSIETLFQKVKAALLPETLAYVENISGTLKVNFGPTKNFSGFRDIVKGLSDATASRKRVEITYKAVSTGRQTKRKVDPYQVWVMNGAFYLIAFCHIRNAVRTFAMDRIKGYKVLDESFVLPDDFNLEDYLQTAFRVMRGEPQKVKFRLKPGAAHVVRERIWHPTQELRNLSDGGVEISVEVPINYEIISWIMGFGSAAEVIEPDSLRKRIMQEHDTAARQYRKRFSQIKTPAKKIPLHMS